MYNTIFVTDDNIPLVHDKDNNFDDYNTSNKSKVDETAFKSLK